MKEVIRLKKRRKIRWSRVLLLIVFLIALLIGVVWLGKNIAVIVQGIQLKYSELVAEQKLHSKFQDEKFKQYANILFFGLDDGDLDQTNSGKRADAVFLISINKQKGKRLIFYQYQRLRKSTLSVKKIKLILVKPIITVEHNWQCVALKTS